MYPVGGSQGQTWGFNEGQGEATILQTPLTDNYISQEVLLQSQERKAKKAKDADDFQKRIDAMNASYQALDIDAQHALKEGVMSFVEDASKYRAESDINPLSASAVDPRSKELQRGYQQLMSLPQMTKQLSAEIKTQMDAYRTDPSKYQDDENLEALTKGLSDGMLQKYMSGEAKVPMLQLKAPTADVMAALSKGLTAAGIDKKDYVAVMAGGPTMIASMLNGPEAEGILNSTKQSLASMSPEALDNLKARSDESGMQPEVQYINDLLENLADPGYTFQKAELTFYDEAKQKVSSISTETGTWPDKAKALKLMEEHAEANPRFMAELEKDPRFKGTTKERLKQWSATWADKPWGPVTSKPAPTDENNNGGGDSGRQLVEDWLVKVEQNDAVARGRVVNAKFPGDPAVRDIGGRDVELGKGTFVSIDPIRELNTGGAITYNMPESTFKVTIRLDEPITIKYADGTPEKKQYQTITVGREEAKRLFAAHIADKLNTNQNQEEVGAGEEFILNN